MSTDPSMIVTLYMAGGVAMALLFLWDWYVDRRSDRLPDLGESGTNDDKLAVDLIKQVIGHTSQRLLIYDDGDLDGKGKSIYNDEGVIEVVAERLRTCGELKIYCFFNRTVTSLRFVDELAQKFPGRFKAKVRRSEQRPDDRHFKIGDGGRVGCVSEHDANDDYRTYSSFDLRGQPFALRWFVFGHYQLTFWLRWMFMAKVSP